MNILVCVKQVPYVEGIDVKVETDGSATLEGLEEFCMNRFDEFAVEQAVQFKSAITSSRVGAVTVGPQRSVDVLRRAIGMGCDEGVHIQIPADTHPEPAAVAAWIAAYARPKAYDLILCGSMSEDGMHGQVGPMVAAHLGWPHATQVITAGLPSTAAELSIEREVEGGARDMLAMGLPALLALQPGINRPRYPSLSNLLRANRQAMVVVPAERLGSFSPTINCVGLKTPRRRRRSRVMTGAPSEKAEKLVALLKAKALI